MSLQGEREPAGGRDLREQQGPGGGAEEGEPAEGEHRQHNWGHEQVSHPSFYASSPTTSPRPDTRRTRESRVELRRYMRAVKKNNPTASLVLQYSVIIPSFI